MPDLELALVGLGGLLLLLGLWRSRRSTAPPEADTPSRASKPPARAAGPDDMPPPSAEGTAPPRPATAEELGLPRLFEEEEDTDELDLTRISIPSIADDEDTVAEHRRPAVLPIVYDYDAAEDAPTGADACILVSAVGQTDRGKKRRKNEDRYLILDRPPLFVVADGMGGYAGGEVASELAVEAMADSFAHASFDEGGFPDVPRRGAEVVHAVRHANAVVHNRAQEDPRLQGMGTTLVCARFSPKKQRLYVGHVGDSRCYVLRKGEFEQVTTDHTVGQEGGIDGPLASTLTRALGVEPFVTVDLILGKPRPGDRYLLCSDGLTKMLSEDDIRSTLLTHEDPADAVDALVRAANDEGGRDNITVIVVRVDPPPRPSAPTRSAAALLIALGACTPPPPTGPTPLLTVPPERPICGWEELDEAEHRIEVDGEGVKRSAASTGAYAAAVVAPGDTRFGVVRAALAPLYGGLVRLKLPVGGRWLVPVTRYGGKPVVPKPLARGEVESVVGHRRVIRKATQPRIRLADLRLDRDASLELYVESDGTSGKRLSIDELESHLATLAPPVGAFTIHADDNVTWAQFVRAAAIAACYDRRPGFEPHEVIWDQRAPSRPAGG